jgi:Uma2 family endonuclease
MKPMVVQLSRRLFTVDDYYRMAEAGILRDDDRVELIEGEIIQMPPIGSPHASVVDRLLALVTGQLPPRTVNIRVQGPVRLDEYSEPQPDFNLMRFRDDFYATAHPTPDQVLLLVEVADTTHAYDRGIKVPLYAVAGVPEVWIANIVDEVIDIYRDPAEGAYRSQTQARKGEVVSPALVPALALPVAEIFG